MSVTHPHPWGGPSGHGGKAKRATCLVRASAVTPMDGCRVGGPTPASRWGTFRDGAEPRAVLEDHAEDGFPEEKTAPRVRSLGSQLSAPRPSVTAPRFLHPGSEGVAVARHGL